MSKTIVLLGKTGTGKSATANLLCGEDAFNSKSSSVSVTKDFQKKNFRLGNEGSDICIIDSPGLFDCSNDDDNLISTFVEFLKQQETVISLFLIVFSLQQRFTRADIEIFKLFDEALGEVWSDSGGIVFTHADMFKDEKEVSSYIRDYSEFYQVIRSRFGERFITIDNKKKDTSNRRRILTFITECMQKHHLPYTKHDLPAKKNEKESTKRQEDEAIKQFKKGHEKEINEAIRREKMKRRLALDRMKEEYSVENDGSNSSETSTLLEDKHRQELRVEKVSSCDTCLHSPAFICEQCAKHLCKGCHITHQFDTVTSSHKVNPIKKKKKSKECTLCMFMGLPLTCVCDKCGSLCEICEIFHMDAYPGHGVPKKLDSNPKKNHGGINLAKQDLNSCENNAVCGATQKYACVDCEKYYCLECIKHIKHDDFHLVLDTVSLYVLPYKVGSAISRDQLIKCVINVSDQKTYFKMYFPFAFIYAPGKKMKSSTTKNYFHVISSKALFHKNTFVSIGETAERHYALVADRSDDDDKSLWKLENVNEKPITKMIKDYYKILLLNLKLHWKREVQISLHKKHIFLQESAIEIALVKTLFIADILKFLPMEFFTKDLECSLVSEEDVKTFIVVKKDHKDTFKI